MSELTLDQLNLISTLLDAELGRETDEEKQMQIAATAMKVNAIIRDRK